MNAATDGNAYLNPKNLATNLFANEDSNESETNKENEQASNQRYTFTSLLFYYFLLERQNYSLNYFQEG
jgi:hypothetical protein